MTMNSRYYRENSNNKSVIIFVHGVFGDSISTWKNANGAYWPELLKNDPDFNNSNIYLLDYPSPAINKSYSIDELAEYVRAALESDGVLNRHSELVFLTHSMGGVVIRSFLIKYREKYADKVKFVYLFATPSTGSPIATLASIISKNPQLGKMRSMQSGDYLADIHRDWSSSGLINKISSYCAYEMKDTYGLRVVDMQSATALCNQRYDPIDKNHIDIVKPSDNNDVSYRAFKSAYLDSLKVPREMDIKAPVQNITVNYYGIPEKNYNELIELWTQEVMQRVLAGLDKYKFRKEEKEELIQDWKKMHKQLDRKFVDRPADNNVPIQTPKKIDPLVKFTPQEFIDNFIVFRAYYRYRKTLQLLNPDKLIELLNIYFRSVLLYPSNSMTKYYITASDGRSLLLQMEGHNEKGNKISISLPDISKSLLLDVCIDFVKSANQKQYQTLIDLFNRAISTPELDQIHKYNLFDVENIILKDNLSQNIRNMPEDDALQTLNLRKSFVLKEIQNQYQAKKDNISLNIDDGLYNLYFKYAKDIVDVLIFNNKFSKIYSFFYNELENQNDHKIVTYILNNLISYNNLFHFHKKEIIKKMIEGKRESFTEEQYNKIVTDLNYSLNDIEMKDTAYEPVEDDKTNFKFKDIKYDNVKTIISFVVPYAPIKDYSSVRYNDKCDIEFKCLKNLFDDPIFVFLNIFNQNINGIPVTIFSDAIDNIKNSTVIIVIIKEFYHPDFELVNDRIEYIDYQEKEAMLGRKYYPHKERIVEIFRKIYDERRADLPINLKKEDININFISNYLVNYVDSSTGNVIIFNKFYGLTNPDSYSKIKKRYFEME